MGMSNNSVLRNNSVLKSFVLFSTAGQSHWQTGKLCREIRRPPHAWLHTLPVSLNTAALLWGFVSSDVSHLWCFHNISNRLPGAPSLPVFCDERHAALTFVPSLPSLTAPALPAGPPSWPRWESEHVCGCRTWPWTCATCSEPAMTCVSEGSRGPPAPRPASCSSFRGSMTRYKSSINCHVDSDGDDIFLTQKPLWCI